MPEAALSVPRGPAGDQESLLPRDVAVRVAARSIDAVPGREAYATVNGPVTGSPRVVLSPALLAERLRREILELQERVSRRSLYLNARPVVGRPTAAQYLVLAEQERELEELTGLVSSYQAVRRLLPE